MREEVGGEVVEAVLPDPGHLVDLLVLGQPEDGAVRQEQEAEEGQRPAVAAPDGVDGEAGDEGVEDNRAGVEDEEDDADRRSAACRAHVAPEAPHQPVVERLAEVALGEVEVLLAAEPAAALPAAGAEGEAAHRPAAHPHHTCDGPPSRARAGAGCRRATSWSRSWRR